MVINLTTGNGITTYRLLVKFEESIGDSMQLIDILTIEELEIVKNELPRIDISKSMHDDDWLTMIEELQDCAVLSGVDQFQEINNYGYSIEKIVDKITDLS